MGTRATLAERDVRYKRIREAMAREGMSALIVAGHGSHFNRGYIRYFTDAHMWAGDALLLIPLESEPTLAWVSYAGAGWPAEPWVPDLRRSVYPEKRIIEAMNEKGLTKGKVGIAGMAKIMPAGNFMALRNAFPKVQFVSADTMTDKVRVVHSQTELMQYREVWKLSIDAMNRFVEVLAPGKTQREVAAEANKVIRAGGSRDDLTTIREGSYAGLPQYLPLKCDDIVGFHMEICGESGHWSEIDVTCAFRKPTDLESRLMDTELRAYDEIRKAAKPGAKLSDLGLTFDRVLADDGWKFDPPSYHFYFHGHGMDDVAWPWYSNMLEDNEDTAVEEGMVLCYHPRRLSWGPKICDDIVITPNGAERLSGDWDLRWRIMV